MAYPYITQAILESRVSTEVLRRVLDDDNDGAADPDPIGTVIADASAKVAGYLRGIYDLDVVAANPPREVVRLTLDVAVAYLAERHPEAVRKAWLPLMEHAETELKALRKGETRLDVVGPPEPPANVGGNDQTSDTVGYDPEAVGSFFGASDYPG